jgi:hypothetical protein
MPADALTGVRTAVYARPMTDTDTPWEPPLAGTEVEHLVGALDRLRTTFRWKADGLDADGLRARIGASSLSIGALLKHLAAVEDYTFTVKLRGESIGAPWEAIWEGGPAVARNRARLEGALAEGGLDLPAEIADDDGVHASLRRLVCDLIEEYGRHTGHADLLREAVDGLVGEDPPPGWKPTSMTTATG